MNLCSCHVVFSFNLLNLVLELRTGLRFHIILSWAVTVSRQGPAHCCTPLWAHPQIWPRFQVYAGCAPLAPPPTEDFVPYIPYISLVWRSLLGLASTYLRDLCHTTMGIPDRRSLRSTEQGLLLVPFAHITAMQNRAFSVVGPSLWNGLSLVLRLLPRIVANFFYAHLKTFLFGRTGIGSAPDCSP